ncbi:MULTISPECIES: phage tail protein [unclassified Streptomyces]|uniref:phage tail protein n=1 Tax=unclassified Streptomyces TaxID=2593676 RepID=UPI00278C634D|nr:MULTISPECIES: phage tail protein [unclassified Streptomyces]
MTPAAAEPRAPTGARAVPSLLGRSVELRWTNPPVAAFDGGFLVGVRVVRRERTFPLDPDDGDLVHDETAPIVQALVDTGLTPQTRLYYTVFTFDGTAFHTGEGARASALATDDYGLVERLYRMLPAVHQRDDRPLRPDEIHALDPTVQDRLRALPPELRGAGQLRRYLAAAAAPLALTRGTAEGLRQLRDIDRTPPDYLEPMAAFLDWRTDHTLPVFLQRGEIRAAPTLYRSVGTVPNLRSIVTRYTGWQVRVAEYAQHLARSHHAPQQNVFALRETGAGWSAAQDAADLLGLTPPTTASAVTGTVAGPFALRPGMELTVSTDATGPVTARFAATDLTTASAAEVAAALDRQFRDLTVTALANGRLRLEAHTGTLRVEPAESSLVTLDGAPRGRLSVVPTGPASFHVFHAVCDPLGPPTDAAARRAVSGRPFPRPPVPGEVGLPEGELGASGGSPSPPAAPVSRVHVKAYRGGQWGDSVPLFTGGEPAAAALPAAGAGQPGRMLLAWVEQPGTPEAQVRFAVGTTGEPGPAVLTGDRGTPFAIPHGSYLVLRDAQGRSYGAQFARTDFADPDAPGITDVLAVINARLAAVVTASAAPGGALRLSSLGSGGDARLTVDLRASTAATALGFGPDNSTATGDWGDHIDWGPVQPLTAITPGRIADLAATADAAAVQLAYARHDGQAWQIRTVRFDGSAWSGDEALTSGVLSSREPSLGREPDGRIRAVWARQGSVGGAAWSLRGRDKPSGGGWSAEAELTPVPPDSTTGDREPALTVRPGLPPRVFFRSDRGGGPHLWAIPVGGAATEITTGAPTETWPAPVTVDGVQWLLYRGDRSVGHAGVGSGPFQDAGTLHRYAGSTTVVLSHLDRLRRLGAFDDLVSYTPHRPAGETAADPLRDDEVYTRTTVGLHLTQAVSGLLDESMADRLRAVLRRFVPLNVRTVVRLAPRAEVEFVYPAAADLADTYADEHPDIDHLGVPGESTAVLLPGWGVIGSALLSAPPPADPEATGTTADPTDLGSLRRRTHQPPLQ